MDIKILASGSSGNAYLVSDGFTTILLDCGIPAKEISERCGHALHEIDACLITHNHQDHCKAAKELARKGIDLYASHGTNEACGLQGHRIHTVASRVYVRIGSFLVLPFDVEHDAPEPMGFVLESDMTGEKLLYFTDTFFLRYVFKGLNFILGECNYDSESLHQSIDEGRTPLNQIQRLAKSHMSVDTFVKMLTANDLSELKQIYLLHMSDRNSNAELIRKMVQEATGAEVFIAHDIIGKQTGF